MITDYREFEPFIGTASFAHSNYADVLRKLRATLIPEVILVSESISDSLMQAGKQVAGRERCKRLNADSGTQITFTGINAGFASLALVNAAKVTPSQIAALSQCTNSTAIIVEMTGLYNEDRGAAAGAIHLFRQLRSAGFKLLGAIENATEKGTCILALKTNSQLLESQLLSAVASPDRLARRNSRSVYEQLKNLGRNVSMRLLGRINKKKIPILIPCFNNPTLCDQMLKQLVSLGLTDITFIDNASTGAQMQKWLNEARAIAKVINLEANVGPHRAIFEPERFAALPRRFCVTDPDLLFNERLPTNFLDDLAFLCEKHTVGKVGFALDISDHHLFHARLFRNHNVVSSIYDWESAFWRKPLGILPAGDRFYDADIDTTFALYDKRYFRLDRFHQAIRVAGRFTAKHLPWYESWSLPREEMELYGSTQKFSVYHAPE